MLIVDSENSPKITLLLAKDSEYLANKIVDDWFETNYWQKQNAITGRSKGRNITWFINYKDQTKIENWVLRHYYRGGMVAKLLKDSYLFKGIHATRAYQEIELLDLMYQNSLPVPQPIAGRIVQTGLFYRNDILIKTIPETQTLTTILHLKDLKEHHWKNLGQLINQFHQFGINHTDLNANNILLDKKEKFWLIDFDKCYKTVIKEKWKKQNIQRLKRSFEKEKSKVNQFYFDQKCWNYFLQGYNQT